MKLEHHESHLPSPSTDPGDPSGGTSNEQTRKMGVRGRVVVKALCYQPEGRGFETR
jgi:hypothetical protein